MNRATSQKPRTTAAFIEEASRLGRAGRDRELLAYVDQFGKEFLDRFAAEEWSRLDGLLEGAQMAVDLEDWEKGRKPAPEAAPAAQTNAVEAATR